MSAVSITEEEGEAEEQTERQPESSQDSSEKVFKVTCRDVAGTLYKNRFASGNYITIHKIQYVHRYILFNVRCVAPVSGVMKCALTSCKICLL